MKNPKNNAGSNQRIGPLAPRPQITPELMNHYLAEGHHLRSEFTFALIKRLGLLLRKSLAQVATWLHAPDDRARNEKSRVVAERRNEGCRHCG